MNHLSSQVVQSQQLLFQTLQTNLLPQFKLSQNLVLLEHYPGQRNYNLNGCNFAASVFLLFSCLIYLKAMLPIIHQIPQGRSFPSGILQQSLPNHLLHVLLKKLKSFLDFCDLLLLLLLFTDVGLLFRSAVATSNAKYDSMELFFLASRMHARAASPALRKLNLLSTEHSR
ncbi:hypothetical protein EK904_014346, partial [Melospiza melodia maxima]